MASSAAAALLDELMGRSRNVIPGKDVEEIDWSNAEVRDRVLCSFAMISEGIRRSAKAFCVGFAPVISLLTPEPTLVSEPC